MFILYFSYVILNLGDVMKYIKKLLILSILVVPFFIGMKDVNAGWQVKVLTYDNETACTRNAGTWLDEGYEFDKKEYRCIYLTLTEQDSISASGKMCEVKFYRGDIKFTQSSWESEVLRVNLLTNVTDLVCPKDKPYYNGCPLNGGPYCSSTNIYNMSCKDIKNLYTQSNDSSTEKYADVKVCPDGYYTINGSSSPLYDKFDFSNYCRRCENYSGIAHPTPTIDETLLIPYTKTCNIMKGDFKNLWSLILIAAPIMVILFAGFDVFKAVTASDEKAMKKATSNIFKRIAIMFAIFLLPLVVNLVIGFTSYDNWDACLGNNLVSINSDSLYLIAETDAGLIKSDTWTSKDVKLTAVVLDEDSNAEYFYEWYIDDKKVSTSSNVINITPSSNTSGWSREYKIKIMKKIDDGKELLASFVFVSKIDNVSPTCTTTGGTNDYVNSSVTIKGICSDKDAECENISKTYDPINKEQNLFVSPGTVYDRAGNSAVCDPVTVKINKIDSNTQ